MVMRFVKFVGACLLTGLGLALAYFLVDTYPEIIGQFVGHSHACNGIESLFQVLIIVLNYIISKFFVYRRERVNKKGSC